jgi:hypothetical protein
MSTFAPPPPVLDDDALPRSRGPVSTAVRAQLAGEAPVLSARMLAVADPLADDDLQLALYMLYELHYRGLPGVPDELEWDPAVIALRRRLERTFEDALLATVPEPAAGVPASEIDLALRAIAERPGPPLARHLQWHGTLAQFREFAIHRSAYQLKEADPHSWAIPRLWGAPKAALVEIQADEYGGGRPDRIHAELFARALRALELDDAYGAYVEQLPGITLATVNLMSMLGLQRRWRGAIMGHLALFEMTSSIPNRRYAEGLRRLGASADATEFFDEHVEADAVHENLAAVDVAGGLVRQQPQLAQQVLWGAEALALLEDRWAAHLLGAWSAGHSSLLG